MYTRIIISVVLIYLTIVNAKLTIVSRNDWGASAPKSPLKQTGVYPPPFVIVHHTDTPNCDTSDRCIARVKGIQHYHQATRGWDDIGYNFLIGGDGKVYEGRGWGKTGAHAPNYNSKSTGISIIGNFVSNKPKQVQLDALKDLIADGVSKGYIPSDYKLIGHRQTRSTTCPGNALFNEIKTWDHFTTNL